MKLAVLQIENRKTPMINHFLKHNKDLSTQYKFEYIFRTEGDSNIPQYWWKVFEIQKIMKTRPDIDLIMWLDSDAYFPHFQAMNPYNLATFNPSCNMWISPDAPPLYNAPFCAGSFLLRNNPIGRQIIYQWRFLYRAHRWQKTDPTTWKTVGPFAGPDYEQGAFIDNILPLHKELGICILPYYVFNENNHQSPSKYAITVHLAGEYKNDYTPPKSDTALITYATISTALIIICLLCWKRFGSYRPSIN